MKKELELLPLIDKFISESTRGKRLQKNGSRIRSGSIDIYQIVRNHLHAFSVEKKFQLRRIIATRLNSLELKSELLYWKRFYLRYTGHLYQKGNFDNYSGTQIKIIRCFFNYLNRDKGIFTGDFHKNFYVRNETIPIIVLPPEQLQFLIKDKEFEVSVSH